MHHVKIAIYKNINEQQKNKKLDARLGQAESNESSGSRRPNKVQAKKSQGRRNEEGKRR